MKIEANERRIWWHWFVYRWAVHKEGGGYGVTGAKLRKCERTILLQDDLWQDVLLRHGFENILPWEAII